MCLYSLDFIDRAGRRLRRRDVEAPNVSFALAMANQELHSLLNSADRRTLDLKGRVDLMDEDGAPVARIYCADALIAMS